MSPDGTGAGRAPGPLTEPLVRPPAGPPPPVVGDDGPRPGRRRRSGVDEPVAARAGRPVAARPAPSATSGRRAESEPRPSRRQQKKAGRTRVRRVQRVLRKVDAWSVLKLGFVVNLCLWITTVVAGVLLWSVARSSGTVENVEGFLGELTANETFVINADVLFRAAVLGGLVLAVFLTGIAALAAVLFNLISDLIGGIRVTVLEEEPPRREPPPDRPRPLEPPAAAGPPGRPRPLDQPRPGEPAPRPG